MLAEEVGHLPEEVFVLALKAVTVTRQIEHFKTFVGAYESIYHASGVRGVYIVVHIACHQQQVAFETACKFLIGAYIV